jgi:hypothetical protein
MVDGSNKARCNVIINGIALQIPQVAISRHMVPPPWDAVK